MITELKGVLHEGSKYGQCRKFMASIISLWNLRCRWQEDSYEDDGSRLLHPSREPGSIKGQNMHLQS
jgi:hypothetical protein